MNLPSLPNVAVKVGNGLKALPTIAFALMLGCAFVIERNIRQVGKVGIQDIAGAVRSRDDDGKSLRDRFRRS